MSLYFNGGSISGGSGGGSDDTYTKAEVNGLLSAKSNTSLDNLNASGQMVVDSQNGTISNCILEIPHTFTLEISGNSIIQKAGSVVALMGYDTYTTTTLANDITVNIQSWQNGKYFVFGNATSSWISPSIVGSGSTLPADGSQYGLFFLTTDKKLYAWDRNNSSWGIYSGFGYPVAIVEVESGVLKGFAKDSKGRDMIFNGAGFIGHHAFVYPNVKALIPTGFNADSTLKSNLFTPNALAIVEMTNGNRCIALNMYGNAANFSMAEVDTLDEVAAWTRTYVKSLNRFFYYNGSTYGVENVCKLADFSYNGTTVTDFTISQPYEGARNLLTDDIEEEVATKQVDVTTLTGYDSTQTQTLKNINGVLTWVTD